MACNDCCPIDVCLNFKDVTTTPEFEEKMKDLFCRLISEACIECPEFGCPDQTGDTVFLCYEGETIEVPQAAVKTLIAEGATCGGCDEGCCPDTPVIDGKIDMCLNGKTINVSTNACKGIENAGGTCGACMVP